MYKYCPPLPGCKPVEGKCVKYSGSYLVKLNVTTGEDMDSILLKINNLINTSLISPNLQQVTDVGNTTSNSIISTGSGNYSTSSGIQLSFNSGGYGVIDSNNSSGATRLDINSSITNFISSIVGVTEAPSENSDKMASTAWVKLQNYLSTEVDPIAQSKTISITDGTGIIVTGTTQTIGSNPQFIISADNTSAIWNANELQGIGVSTTTPTTGQALVYNGSQWAPGAGGGGGGITSVAVTSSDITVTGSPITSSGTITLTLPNLLSAGTYNSLTVNAKGLVTSATNQPYITTETDPTVPTIVKNITQTDIDNWNNAFDKFTTGIGVTGTTTKTITITLNDSSTVLGAFTDENNFPTSLSFNNTNGIITLGRNGLSALTANLDGRYLTSYTETDPTVPSHVKAITTTNISNWNAAFNNQITAAAFSPGTLTLTQQDGGTVIASGLTTSNVTEGTNLYYTDARVQTFSDTRYALQSTTILPSGNGLTGGGDLSINRIFSLDFSYLDDRYLGGYKQRGAVRVTTSSNITLSGTQTIDGIGVIAGDRVLVKSQTAPAENGIYIVAAGAYTRATDFDQATPEEISQGSQIFVQEGTVNGKTGWSLSTPEPYTIGTTGLTFIQYAGANTYTAGTGLTLIGNQFSALTTTALWNANQLRGVNISVTAPTSNQILRYDGTNWTPFTPNYLVTETDPIASAKTVTITQGSGIAITGTATQTIGANPSYTVAHADTSAASSIDTSGAQVIDTITIDTYGHITASTLRSLTASDIGAGTVTSVGLSMPSIFAVTNSPVTTSGTLTSSLNTQAINVVFAGPSSGGVAVPTFRALVSNDIPALDAAKITSGIFPIVRGGTGLSALGTANQLIRVNAGVTALEYFTPTYISGNQTITLSGDVTGSGATAIATIISNNVVTYAKIQDVTSQRLLGRYAATTGDPQEITIGSGLSLDNTTGVLTATAGGVGTVTSVGLSLPSIFTVSGSPVTTSGTLTAVLASQTTNLFFASPNGSTGTPSFRAIVNNDLPNSGVVAGTYNTLIVNTKGIVTSASNTSYTPTTRTLTLTAGTGVSVSPVGAQDLSSDRAWTITNTGVTSFNGSGGVITFNPTLQTVTTNGRTTSNWIQITGFNGVTATGSGLELFAGGAPFSGRVQSYDRVNSVYLPTYILGGTTSTSHALQVGDTLTFDTFTVWNSSNHPTGSAFTPTLTGANVPATFTSNSSGHVTTFTTRVLTASDISAAPATGSGNYIQNQTVSAQAGAGFFTAGSGRANGGFIGPNLQSANSVGSVALIGGDSGGAGFRGAQIDLFAGNHASLAGMMIFRTGITNAGAAQAERMRITSAGNVGIGSTDPQDLLHILTPNGAGGLRVQSTLTFGGGSGAFARFYNSGTPTAVDQRLGGLLFGSNPTGTTVRTGAQIESRSEAAWTDGTSHPTYMTFLTVPSASTGVTERMRITASGNVGIGLTNPAVKLDVAGGINADLAIQTSNGTVTTYLSYISTAGIVGTGSAHPILLHTSGIERARIDTSGNLGIGITPTQKLHVSGNGLFTGTVTATGGGFNSLRALKNNIKEFSANALDIISKLDVKKFKYNTNTEDQFIGLIAEETPEELLMNKGTALNIYNTLGILIKGIQELNRKIDGLGPSLI